MRYLLCLLFLLFGLISIAQPTNGLIAYWKFDGNTQDASGYENHGTLTNPAMKTQDRSTDSCALFFYGKYPARTGDSMLVSNKDVFMSDQITISVWCFVEDWYSLGPIKLFGKTGENNQDYLFTLQNQLTFMGNSFTFRPFGKWNHFVATYSDGSYNMYINNALVRSGTTTKVVHSDSFISIGKYLSGKLDDLRIYNRALSAQEIGHLYNSPGSCSITTRLTEDESESLPKPIIIDAYDIQGRKINSIEEHSGLAVLVYSDGTHKKVIK